jgi:hypothetical protein
MWYLIQAIIDLCRSLNWVCDWTVYMLWIWEDLVKWLYSVSQELLQHYCWSQDSTVSVVSRPTGWTYKKFGFDPWQVQESNCFSEASRSCLVLSQYPIQKLPDLLWGPPNVLFSGVLGGCIPCNKETMAWSWPLTLSVAKVKNQWRSASTPLYAFVHLWEQFCLLLHHYALLIPWLIFITFLFTWGNICVRDTAECVKHVICVE